MDTNMRWLTVKKGIFQDHGLAKLRTLILLEINILSTLMEQDFIFQVHVVDIQFIRMVQEIGTLFYQTEQGLTQQVLIQEGNFTLMKMVSYMN